MQYIALFLFVYILGFILAVIPKKKVSKLVLINFVLTGIFFFGIIIVKFFMINFHGDINILIFLDENTYVNGVYNLGFFGRLVKIIVDNFGVIAFRCLNIFVYIFSITLLLNEINFKINSKMKIIISSIIIFSCCIISYWSFFILKEALTIAAMTIVIKGFLKHQKSTIILASILLFIVRLNYFALLMATIILYYLYKKSKKNFYISILFSIVIALIFLSTKYAYSIKLGIIARRFGDSGMVYTGANAVIASKSALGFILSKEYIQAILGNMSRSFFVTGSSSVNNIFSLILTINNLLLLIINFAIKPKKDMIYFFYIFSIAVLILTYSDYRYFNTIMLPFTIYFFFQKYKVSNMEGY